MKRMNFNLSCLIINCVISKLFLDYSGFLLGENGSAAALSAALSAVLFSVIAAVVFMFRKTISGLIERRLFKNTVFAALAAYFICRAIYHSYVLVNNLSEYEYINTNWFMILAVIAVAVYIVSRGGKGPLFKLHGLCVPIIAVGLVFIIMNAVPRCDLFNAAPVLGNGSTALAVSVFKNLFAFSEILLPAAYLMLFKEERKSKYVLASIITGAALYSVYYIVLFLAVPPEYARLGGDDLTRMAARFSGMRRLNMRLDALNIIISSASAILYISALLIAVKELLLRLGFRGKKTGKGAAAVTLCALMIIPLAGCGEARDVENTAYVIAAGVDNSYNGFGYKFTLQFSNPLKNGGDTSEDPSEQSAEENEGGSSVKKPVSNITVGARNIFEALEKSKSYIGKSPSLSHMKLIVISNDLLDHGTAEANEIFKSFLRADDVRPETKLCAAENAGKYLISAEPDMEESAARYYELLFSERSAVGSFETNLLEFISASEGSARMAEVTEKGLSGGMLFPVGLPPAHLSEDECRLINTALGKTDEPMYFTSSEGEPYRISGKCRVSVRARIENGSIYGRIILRMTCPKDISGNMSEMARGEFETRIRESVSRTYAEGTDIFELRKIAKVQFFTESEYNDFMKSNPSTFLENIKIIFVFKN